MQDFLPYAVVERTNPGHDEIRITVRIALRHPQGFRILDIVSDPSPIPAETPTLNAVLEVEEDPTAEANTVEKTLELVLESPLVASPFGPAIQIQLGVDDRNTKERKGKGMVIYEDEERQD